MVKRNEILANIGDKTAVMKLDDLLGKVDLLSGLSDSLLTEYDHKVKGTKETININGVRLFEKGKVKYNFKSNKRLDNTVLMVIDAVRNNKYIDREWLSLMDLSIQYGIRGGSKAIGRAYGWSGRIELQKMFFKDHWDLNRVKDVMLHEIGHIWFTSVLAKFDIDEWRDDYEYLAVGLFLKENGVCLDPNNWKLNRKNKEEIRNNISYYGGTNIHEAFAELFMYAYSEEDGKWDSGRYKKNELALKAIKEVNKIIWVKIWNSFN